MQPMKYIPWTTKEIEILKKNYPLYGRIYCVKKLNRSVQSIMCKAQKMGLYGGGRKRWTTEEMNYLLKSYNDPLITKEEMVNRLGRSWVNIGVIARSKGLKLPIFRKIKARVYQKRIKERLQKKRGYGCEYSDCKWTKTIELHHMDGDRNNNNEENLQLLCPNHHSITRSWMMPKKYRFR